jgi:uncharacterized membrane protein
MVISASAQQLIRHGMRLGVALTLVYSAAVIAVLIVAGLTANTLTLDLSALIVSVIVVAITVPFLLSIGTLLGAGVALLTANVLRRVARAREISLPVAVITGVLVALALSSPCHLLFFCGTGAPNSPNAYLAFAAAPTVMLAIAGGWLGWTIHAEQLYY